MTLNIEKRKNKSNLSLSTGMYSESVKHYLDVFGTNQVKIIIFEELIKDTKNYLQEILKFLGLNYTITNFKPEIRNPYGTTRGVLAEKIIKSQAASGIAKKIMSSTTRRLLKDKVLLKKSPKPKMDEKDRDILINFYREDVEKLQTLIGRKLPWANF